MTNCINCGAPPHGRLIDADALPDPYSIPSGDLVMSIMDAPTIIPAEED